MEHTQSHEPESTGSILESAAEVLQNQAADLGRQAKRISSEALEQRVDQMFGFLGHIEKAVRAAARELENEHHPHIAQYVDQAADEVGNARERFESKNFNELIESAETMARTRPIVAAGLAFAAGFAFVRLLKGATHSKDAAYDPHEELDLDHPGIERTPSGGQVTGGYGATYEAGAPASEHEQAGLYAGAGDYDRAVNEEERQGTGSYSTGTIRERERRQGGGGAGYYGGQRSGEDDERRGASGLPEHLGSEQPGSHASTRPNEENLPPRSRRGPVG